MRSASHVRLRATTLKKVRVRVCVHLPFGLSLSDCQFEDQKPILRHLICVAATSRPELVVFLVFKTSTWTSDEGRHSDCRHGFDDEESHHLDLDEGDHVHESHDYHCSASGPEDCLVVFSLVPLYILFSRCSSVFTVSVPSSSEGLHELVLVSVVSPYCTTQFLSLHLLPCQILPCRLACILVRACAFDTAILRGGAPRSFRNCAHSRNPSNLSLS